MFIKKTDSVVWQRRAALRAALALTPNELAIAVLAGVKMSEPAIVAVAGRVLSRTGRANPADLDRLRTTFIKVMLARTTTAKAP